MCRAEGFNYFIHLDYLISNIFTCIVVVSFFVQASALTTDAGFLQKGADFVQAFMMGFEVQDAVALLRLDDLFIGDTYKIPFI